MEEEDEGAEIGKKLAGFMAPSMFLLSNKFINGNLMTKIPSLCDGKLRFCHCVVGCINVGPKTKKIEMNDSRSSYNSLLITDGQRVSVEPWKRDLSPLSLFLF